MRKITLMLFLLVCVVGFGQQTPSAEELLAPLSSTNATRVSINNSPEARQLSASEAQNAAYYSQQRAPSFTMVSQSTSEIEAELLAAANRRTFDVPMVTYSNNRSVLADIIPTAGATETFSPAVGDNFFDPGGPGGSSTGGTPGNYPNCGCITTTTLDGVTEIEFLFFSVFATFDWLVIYDSADTSGPELYNNASGGANQGDITLADMIASNGSASFVGTSGSLTFEFRSSTVVDYGGWDAEIIAASGGGGGTGCSQDHPIAGSASGAGVGSSLDSDFKTASDIVVSAGEDFTIDTIEVNFLTLAPTDPPVSATIVYYEDAGGLPGTMIGTETVVPTIVSSGPWINPVADQYVTSMAVTPFTFAGDATNDTTYWIEIAMGTATNQGTVFWEATLDTPVEGEAAAQFDATVGTWSIPDPAQEVLYNYSGECEPIVGGMTCSQDHPVSATVGGGSGSSVDSDFKTAADITVATGEDFTIDTIEANFLTFAPSDPPTTANVVYYEDAGGLPGTMIGSETVVPTIISSSPWANPVADQYLTSLALTPFTFSGDAGMDTKYWIEVSMGTATNQATVFWEYTPDTPVEGEAFARYDGTVGTWSIIDPTQEVIYNFSGECTPIMPPVDNDACMDATAVACGDTVTGDTSDNTDQGGANTSPDEWFKFTGTGSPEVVTVSLCDGGTAYDSVISVYDSCGGTQVVVNDDSCGLQSEASFLSDGTTTYYIAVEGFGTNSGAFSLAVTCAPLAPNDLCENAIAISCGDSIMGTTNNSTIDDAVAPLCDTGVTSPGVWYVFDDTSGLASDVTITLCGGGTAYDSKLSVYTGDCGAPPLTCVVGNDDSCGLQSEVSFSSDGNTTFYVLVHGFGGQTGDFSLDITCDLIPPPNDLISNSIDIDEIGCPFTDPAVAMPAATTESGNPMGCDISGANGVWYNYTAPGDGFITGTIVTPAGASAITFYEAPNENAAVTDLVLVDYFQNQCVPGSTATIPVVSGQAYYAFVLNTGGVTDITFECDVLGTDENTIEGFAFYPNPADNTINFSSIDTIENVTLYNILGQEVVSRTIDATTAQIDVHNLASGTYIMKVSVNGELGTYKVIKR
tara:strand:- start:9256 stop:12528 length:3273 start_codon:yes stop_codon:yes gene_type:complete